MNKRNTTKLTKIASLAALLLSVSVAGSAYAAPNAKGDKGSIRLFTVCKVLTAPRDDYPDDAWSVTNAAIEVKTTITDASSVPGDAVLTKMTVQAKQKTRGKTLTDVGAEATNSDPEFKLENGKEEVIVTLPLCTSDPMLGQDAKSVNAVVTVEIEKGHKEFTARCSDDPSTWDVDEVAELNVFKAGLCQ